MRAAWVTDPHLEFLREEAKREQFLRSLGDSGADAILLGGDIQIAGALTDTLRQVEDHTGVQVYFVLGNHDYYYGSIRRVRSDVRVLCAESKRLIWLNESGAVSLSEETALVGHEGRQSSDEFLPFFCSYAVGIALRATMERYPDQRMTVLCGHTHGHGHCQILPNLEVFTGGAVCGEPRIQRIFEF